MNFNNLQFTPSYVHSQAKLTYEYSGNAEISRNNFKQINNERERKELALNKYNFKHYKSQTDFENEQRFI